MKKLIFILACIFCLTACTKTVYVDSETGNPAKIVNNKVQVESFVNFEIVAEDASFTGSVYYILRDRNTDVLYYKYIDGYKCGITPIMKPDGTCLTYKEWKERL